MYHSSYTDRQERREEKLDQYTILTPRDIMDILGIGKNAAYALLNSGQLHGFRVGRSWRVSAEALEEFMATKHAWSLGKQPCLSPGIFENLF